MDQLTGQTVKGYELRECLGQGGFGAVYRAFQPLLGRDVAVKVIRAEFANHPDFIRRFETEAQVIARLEHPHIVPLYDYWRDPTGAFLVMRWLRGGSLHDALAAGPLALPLTVCVLEQLAGALTAAHRRGVIHRDLKPANVLRDADGNAYLADFGIAKDLGTGPSVSNTANDVMVGSPAYMAPEQIKQDPVTPQTDIYLLGVLLYELLTGQPPFAGATPTDILYQHLYEPLPLLRVQRPDLPGALDAVLQQATQKAASARYPDALSLLADFAAASGVAAEPRALAPPVVPAAVVALEEPANPYKGLRAFQEADTSDFFGRDALVGRLLARLGERAVAGRFLAVVGPSGSGKSSVVRAGLLPNLRQGSVPGSARWFVTEFVPGPHPLEELEAALLRVAVNPPASLLEQLQWDTRGLSRAVKRVLPTDDRTELVLLIDQFEEVFTLVEDERLRAHLLNSLALAVADPRSRLRVVLTLRADFYDRPLLYADLGELMRRGTELVLPLTARELEQAIVRPAAQTGVTLEPILLATMIKDVGDQPGALPLLQYALTELFEHREGRQMTLAGYQASGGILGALGRRADEIYRTFTPAEQELVRQVFLRLVTLGEGVEDTRRRVRQSELTGLGRAEALAAVLEGFGQYRLLTFDRDPITREPTVEVAHEALLRTWGRVREWLDGSRADLRVQRQLAAAAAEWARAAQEASYLARGTRLVQFEALAATGDVALTDEERTYLTASVAARERQTAAEHERQARELDLARQAAAAAEQVVKTQRNVTQRLRILVGIMAVLLLGLAGLAVYARTQQSEAQAFGQHAQASAATAVANGAEANAQRARAVANGAAADAQRATAVANGVAADNARATAVVNLTHSEALRLAAEGSLLSETDAPIDQIALLSIRSVRDQYTQQGDSLMELAAGFDYPRSTFGGGVNGIWAGGGGVFSADGKYLLDYRPAGDPGNTATLLDAIAIRPVISFTSESFIVGATLSPNGKLVATAVRGGTVVLWDATSGQQLRTFSGHAGDVTSLAFSSDDQTLLTGSADQTARLWDAATARPILTFTGHTDAVNSVAFAPDGKTVLTGSADQTARLWDAATARPVLTFTGHTDGVNSVAFAPDGKTVLTGSADQTARLWDVATARPVLTFTGHTGTVYSVAFAPDGKTVLTGSGDESARLWDAASGQELYRYITRAGAVMHVAFSPNGKTVLTDNFAGGFTRLWDLQPIHDLPQFAGHPGSVWDLAFSPDGKLLLTGGNGQGDGTARLWDVRTGAEVRRFAGHGGNINSVAFAPDGKTIMTCTGGPENKVRFWDLQSGALLRSFSLRIPGRLTPFEARLAPDGKTVLADTLEGTAVLADALTGQVRRTFESQGVRSFSLYSPDSKTAFTISGDLILRMWDLATGRELRRFTEYTSSRFMALSPDGKRLLTGDSEGTVRLWDVATGAPLRTANVLAGPVSFSPDGKSALLSANDNTILLWDTNTGQVVRYFSSPGVTLYVVAVAPDGKTIASGADNGMVRLWHVDYHDTLRNLCARLSRDFTDSERTQFSILDKGPTCPGP
jgi:WD40 repeat protein